MRILAWILGLAVLAALAAGAAFTLADPERVVLDDAARRGAPGQFVQLADGITHYEVAGPDTGRVVLLAAAFSVPAYLSDTLFQQLGRAGFRAVRFDYYGRGWSDRPMVTYDLALFDRQIAGLLDSLRIAGPVDVIGLSFGAAIVTDFAEAAPGRVRSLTYINPVFNARRPLPPQERSALRWSIHMVLRGGLERMAAGQMEDFYRPERHPDWVARYREQFRVKGTREALRRTRAAIAVAPDQAEQLRRVGGDPRPVLVVWGREDGGVTGPDIDALLAAMPRATLVAVDSAGHLPHLDRPEVVVPSVLDFYRRSAMPESETRPLGDAPT